MYVFASLYEGLNLQRAYALGQLAIDFVCDSGHICRNLPQRILYPAQHDAMHLNQLCWIIRHCKLHFFPPRFRTLWTCVFQSLTDRVRQMMQSVVLQHLE